MINAMTFNFDVKTKKKLTGTLSGVKNSVRNMVTNSVRDRKKLLFFAGIIMILLPVAYLTLKKPSTAEASWWAGGGGEWQKRKHLTITNDSTDDLAANTTVAVSLDTKGLADTGKVKSDCADVRIVYQPNSTTQTELDRYLSYPDGQTCETSGATKIYFSLQAALTTGSDSEDYYVYFDNNEATPPSTQIDAFDIGSKNALLACPFDGTTTCINGDGTEDPTTKSGAVRYGGGNSSLYFDGYDAGSGTDRVHYPGSGLDNLLLNDTTIEFWAFWHNDELVEVADTIVAKDWEIYFAESVGRVSFGGDCSTQDLRVWSDNGVINFGEWIHIAATFDSGTGVGEIFINGTKQTSYTFQDACQGGYNDDSDRDFWVGRQSVVSNHFPGFIDEVRVSNVIRYTSDFTPQTAPFIRDDYTELLYHFDEAGDDPRKTTLALDDSGNGFDGTIDGAKHVTGVVGIAPPADSNIDSQSYASHAGIFIEENTTNKITNPSFEHSTYDTNWTASPLVTSNNSNDNFLHFGSYSAKLESANTRYKSVNYTSHSQPLYSTTADTQLSQGFQVSTGYSPSTASLLLRRTGSASRYVRVEIQTNSSGVPSGTPVTSGTSDCIDYASVSTASSFGYHDFTFATPPSLTASTQYHLVFRSFTDAACSTAQSSTDDTNYIVWAYDNTSSSYSYGDRAVMNDSSTWSTQTDEDHIFALTKTGTFLTGIDAGNTADHTLSAYAQVAYAGHIGVDGGQGYSGGEIDDTMIELVFDGTAQTTTYTDMGGGWWRMTYTGTPPEGTADYGFEIKTNKIVAVDGVQLEENDYTTTYTDGSLGTGYSWSGTENDSTSTRSDTDLQYSNTNNIDKAAGSLSMWVKFPTDSAGLPSDNYIIYDSGYAVDGSYRIFYDSFVDQYSFRKFAGGSSYDALVVTSFSANDWVHLLATWDTSSGIALYVNAGTPGTDSNTTEPSSLQTNMYLGDSSLGNEEANLSISDFRILDDSLTAAEVTDLYYSGLVAHSQEYEVDAFSGDKGQDPVAVWHFDEGYGTTANDSSSYGNDLTVTGASWEVGSVGGRSKLARNLSFDGSDDYLSRYTDKDFNFSNDSFTISGWVRHPADSDGTQDTILARYGDAGYKVYMDGSGYLCFGIDEDSSWSPADEACGSTDLTDSRWHHFSAVKDGTTSITMYVNGESVGSDVSLSATGSLNTTSTLYVGIDSDEQSYPFEGYIDEVIIYPYARSADQINSDFAGGQTGVVFGQQVEDWMTDGLVGYWPMDDDVSGDAQIIIDYSGNGVDGTTEEGLSGDGMDCTGTGKYNLGCSLDGSDDYITLGNYDGLEGAGSMTISAWIYPGFDQTHGSDRQIFDEGNIALFYKESVGRFRWVLDTNDTTSGVDIYNLTWTANTWHHISVTYTGNEDIIYWDASPPLK